MATYLTIDGGTTNTRISLVKDGTLIDTLKFHLGARAGIDNRSLLETTIRDGIAQILKANDLTEADVKRILAAGMITSEFGLLTLEHLVAPAGISELAAAAVEIGLPHLSTIPFVFLRGVKTACESLETADMMRGEETELMGILGTGDGECVVILPGSHSKIIQVDASGRIVHFTTMLTGEMVAALSQNTILKGSLELSEETDGEYLFRGYTYCREHGINEALFKVRVLKNLFSAEKIQVYSFFLGVILCAEIEAVCRLHAPKIVIGGRKQLKEATALLLSRTTDSEVVCVPDETVEHSASLGMIRVFEYGSQK